MNRTTHNKNSATEKLYKICRNTTQNTRKKKNKIKKSQLKPKTKRKTTKLISNSNLLSTRRHVVKAKAERGG